MNEDIDEREARHAEAMKVIEEEGLGEWLSDESNAVGGRFYILPDGRTFEPVPIEWEQVAEGVEDNLSVWSALRRGWKLIPKGYLAGQFPLEIIWKSGKDAGGWEDGALLSDEKKALLRLAAGDRAIDDLEESPPRRTIWDKWTEQTWHVAQRSPKDG